MYSVYSQEKTKLSLGFEVGSSFVTGDLNSNWNVRQDIGNSQYGSGTTNNIRTDMIINSLGIKPGISFFQNMLRIRSGLQFTVIHSILGNNSGVSSGYFYLSDNSTTTSTNYYKVKNIIENNHYLGVPLDVTILPFRNDVYNLYLKVGTELNFRFLTNRHIHFHDPAMKTYEQVLLDEVHDTPNALYSSVYSAVGIQFGRKNQVKYDLELILPSYILTKNNSSMIDPQFYTGFKFDVQIPVKRAKSKKTK